MATYWQLAGQSPILDDLSHSDPIPLCLTHLLCNGNVEGPCGVVSKWGGLKEILREGKVEHGVALVWDSERSCHIRRASIVSSWIDYPLKGIGRDKKKKNQSQNMTLMWLQTINTIFLSLAQAIYLVCKWVHRLCSTLWRLGGFKQVVKTSSRDRTPSQMTPEIYLLRCWSPTEESLQPLKTEPLN